jgi:hypothetical protein
MSTMYVSWWSARPRTIIKTLRRTLKAALLEAGLKVTSMSRAQREKQKRAGFREAFARYLKEAEALGPPTTAAKNATAKRAAMPLEEPISPGSAIEPVSYKVGPMPPMPPLPLTPYPYTRPYVFTDGTVEFKDGFIQAMRLDFFERKGLARGVPFGIEFETREQKLWLLGRKAFAPRFTHDVNKIAGAKADVDDILNADARSAERQPWKE